MSRPSRRRGGFRRSGAPRRNWSTAIEKLTARSLNRALLARQMLLARERRGVLESVRFLAGMQSQVPVAPYVGLWTRLLGFDPEEVSALMTERALVRVSAMRGTVHLLDAADALAWRPLCQVVNDRGPYGKNIYRKALSGIDPVRFKQTASELLAREPMTNAALGAALAEVFPGHDPGTLAWAIRDGLALVQVPPRGLWGKSGQTTSTTLEHWLGRPLDPDPDPDAMVLRYLAAFGPAGADPAGRGLRAAAPAAADLPGRAHRPRTVRPSRRAPPGPGHPGAAALPARVRQRRPRPRRPHPDRRQGGGARPAQRQRLPGRLPGGRHGARALVAELRQAGARSHRQRLHQAHRGRAGGGGGGGRRADAVPPPRPDRIDDALPRPGVRTRRRGRMT